MSAFAALSMVAASLAATAAPASAAAPAAAVAQAADEKGVIIVALQKDGPAAQAGLRRGDIVLQVNGAEVNDAQALRDAIAKLKAGDEVELRVARGDAELTLKVTLGDADGRAILGVTPFQAAAQAMPAPAPAPENAPESGNQPRQPRGQQMDPKQAEEWRKQLEEQFAAMAKTRVAEVTADSPAAKAGLKAGDVILAVDGAELGAEKSLADVIGSLKPNDEVTLKIERDGKEQELKVTLGENPDKEGAAFLGIRYAPVMVGMPGMPGGLRLPMPGQQNPRGDMPFELPMPEGMQQGAVAIGEVVKDSPAEQAGLQQGDTIVAANDKEIKTPQDVVDLVKASKPGDTVVLSVQRQGEDKPIEITVTLGENPDQKGAAFMGVSLGTFIRMERMMPGNGNEGGLEILPGLNLPFSLDDLPFDFEMPREQSASESEL